MSTMTWQKRLLVIIFSIVIILLIPLIAMQFSSEVNWSVTDFLIMGGLLLGAGLLFDFVVRTVPKYNKRIAWIAIILLVFLLIWAELAVGIFGTPFAGS